ncbi:hypothetical protein LJ739_10685 [Aestuariibacter halophilus]|uniref:Uncharacterized protein n=1 Tax=Fluctibacter halophilus TaxID=226011 RepID=A0ABS8G801_9ALTE|nr:hypothetical protein [Aestuariibacter halophilus]MCC2616707.1 hypothetical protein [Aestuariibacter halophilus]
MTYSETYNAESKAPTHSARIKHGQGKQAHFETVGVAWLNEDGKITVQLYGKQIVEGRIYCSRIKNSEA